MAAMFQRVAALRRRPLLVLLLTMPLLLGVPGVSGTLLNILIPDSKAPPPTGAIQASKVEKPLVIYPSRPIGAPVQVPILMYHYVRVNPDPRDLVGANLSVDPALFAQQMEFLVEHGFQTITLDDLVAALRYGTGLPPKPVILTFDDGYADLHTAAFPVLQRLGLKATSFVITSKVGAPGYLTWDAMQAMQATGLVQFESHTVDHLELGQMALTEAQYQLTTSKTTLESHLGVPVKFLSYPSGSYNAAVENLLGGDGYLAAVTTQYGVWQHVGEMATLPRMRIAGGGSLTGFAAQLGESVTAPDKSARSAPTPVPTAVPTVSMLVPDLPDPPAPARAETVAAPGASGPAAPPPPTVPTPGDPSDLLKPLAHLHAQ